MIPVRTPKRPRRSSKYKLTPEYRKMACEAISIDDRPQRAASRYAQLHPDVNVDRLFDAILQVRDGSLV